MRYRPEGMPSLLSNQQEGRIFVIGGGIVATVGLIGFGLMKLSALIGIELFGLITVTLAALAASTALYIAIKFNPKRRKNITTFQNPVGNWEYDGAFSVELTDDANTSIAPDSAEVNGTTVTVKNGHIKQVAGGIQLRSREQPFYWGFSRIKVIRDGEGALLWVNRNYR